MAHDGPGKIVHDRRRVRAQKDAAANIMNSTDQTLRDLGWDDHFAAQLTPEEATQTHAVRVMAVHRGQVEVVGAGVDRLVSPYVQGARPTDDHPTVGDWLLIADDTLLPVRVLARKNLFKRRAPGDARKEQMIAANVDTVFIVASCNQDFSVARLERYLVLAREAGVQAVVVLTKIDLTETPADYVAAIRAIEPDLAIETVDGREPAQVARLAGWCGVGQTVAFLGSSGVGKSTLVNSLRGSDSIATQAIRANDDTGRHTTTVRRMHRLDHGGWLLDLPGMRELQLSEAAEGIADVFDDFTLAAADCRFSNCSHGNEPSCAVRAAIEAGTLTRERFDRWRLLAAAESANAAPVYKRRPR
jgi:ribosome biogenesis GTPase